MFDEQPDGDPHGECVEEIRRLGKELAELRAKDEKWFALVMDIGRRVGCLASSFPDGNDHILGKLPAVESQAGALSRIADSLCEYSESDAHLLPDTSGPRGTYGCACVSRDARECAAMRYGFDEQQDGDPHGECAAEIHRLTEENDLLQAALEDRADVASKALAKAWRLGQTYWQQADSEYTSQHRKADETQAKFQALVDETRAAILADVTPNGEVQRQAR